MSRTFTKKITKEELAQKIIEALEKHEDYKDCCDGDLGEEDTENLNKIKQKNNPISLLKCYGIHYNLRCLIKNLTPIVRKDLDKVEFDTENIEFNEGEGFAKGKTGLITLDNGLTFLGITSGGDWEHPIYFIVFFDGKKLRGYIPTEGNVWNTQTHKAYGNDQESDEKNIKKRFNIVLDGCYGINFDQKEINKDIEERIVFNGEK